MRLDIEHIFEDTNTNIKLIAESFEETNYGRTYWKYKFYIKDKIVENDILNYEDDGLFTNLKHFQFSSDDGNYFFVPKYNPVIYNLIENKFIEFKAPLKVGNSDFVKNHFFTDTLVIVFRTGLAIVDLKTNSISSIEYPEEDVYIENVSLINNKEIEIDYRDLIAESFKKKIIKL